MRGCDQNNSLQLVNPKLDLLVFALFNDARVMQDKRTGKRSPGFRK
jgi:hypothetical protein